MMIVQSMKSSCRVLLVVVWGTSCALAQLDPLDLGGGATGDGQGAAQQPDPANFLGFQSGPRLSPEEEQAQREQIDTLNAQAQTLADQGDLDGAIAKYDEALAVSENFISRSRRGSILLEQGYPEEAIQMFIQALSSAINVQGADIRKNYQDLGQAYLDTEQYNTAIAAFTQAMSLPGESRNPELLFDLGKAQAEFALNQQYSTAQTRTEDLQKALVSFDRAIEIRPDYAEALFERGSNYLLLGDLDSALDDLKLSVEIDPSNAEAVAQVGFASLRRSLTESSRRNGQRAQIVDDLQLAVRQLTRYLELVPELPPGVEQEDDEQPEILRENIYLQRSAAYIGLGDELEDDRELYYRNAITDADASIALSPNVPDGHYQKGLALRMMGDLEPALDAFTEALEVSPANTEALLRRAILYYRMGDLELAKSDLTKCLRYSAGANPRASFWLGLCYADQDQPIRAVNAYTQAVRYQPFYTMAYFNRALSYMKLGRLERATDDLNQVLRRQKDHEQARQLRARAMELLKRR